MLHVIWRQTPTGPRHGCGVVWRLHIGPRPPNLPLGCSQRCLSRPLGCRCLIQLSMRGPLPLLGIGSSSFCLHLPLLLLACPCTHTSELVSRHASVPNQQVTGGVAYKFKFSGVHDMTRSCKRQNQNKDVTMQKARGTLQYAYTV